jgi:hypothetical protein
MLLYTIGQQANTAVYTDLQFKCPPDDFLVQRLPHKENRYIQVDGVVTWKKAATSAAIVLTADERNGSCGSVVVVLTLHYYHHPILSPWAAGQIVRF